MCDIGRNYTHETKAVNKKGDFALEPSWLHELNVIRYILVFDLGYDLFQSIMKLRDEQV